MSLSCIALPSTFLEPVELAAFFDAHELYPFTSDATRAARDSTRSMIGRCGMVVR